MNDTTASSSLAITEKRPHRPGCVGIFFQLFDWNRRFAKKKLFSKKLVPPARAKQATKKFGGDDKLPKPKLRLIADENSGGFPTVKKNETRVVDSEQKHGVRAPGLVARLMGLESIPAVKEDKLKKASSSEIGVDRVEKFVSDHHGFGQEDRNLEKRGTKHDLRPEKLQKTGQFERRPVTRFGAEALQFKNILSRSRKHHPKLASPVKSPKNLSTRNASRLIGAATKILEPGLQSRNRAKCALTYSKTMHHTPTDESILEALTSAAKSLKGQSSCRNCGNLLDILDTRPNIEEAPPVFSSSVSNYVNPYSQGLERTNPRSPFSSFEQEKESVFQNGQEHFTFLAAQAMDNVQPRAEPISDRMPLDQQGQIQWHLERQPCKTPKDSPTSIRSKHKTQRQYQASPGRDRVPPRSKLNNLQSSTVASAATNATNETKDFVALNRSLSGRNRSRMPASVDNLKFDTYRKFGNRKDDSLSPVRKRRSMNTSRQGESSSFVRSTLDKQKHISCNPMTGKEMEQNAHSTMNRTCITSRLAHLGESNRTAGSGKKDNDVISLVYSSPSKHNSGIFAEKERRGDPNNSTCNSTLHKNSMSAENEGKTCFQKPFLLSGDTLGAFIEQKLKELICQEEDEMAFRGTPPKRTSAIIRQELISALTAEIPYPQDDVAVRSNGKIASCYRGHMSNTNTNITFQAKPKIAGASARYSHDNDHLSPGSVLEAAFSNDSCFSSSLDDSSTSGHKLHADSMDCSYREPQPLEPDADLLDCATSFSNGRTGGGLVTDLLDRISEVLTIIDPAGTRLKGIKLTQVKEVVLDAELAFRNAVLHNSDGTKRFSISGFLLDLETLGNVFWMNLSCFLGFKDTKEGNLLQGFLFDCVVEHLESRYGQYSKSGFKVWTRLPLCMDTETMIREVVDEVRRWTILAGLIPDELIEREMSCCLGKWTDFEIEAFETGVEIDGDILQSLVDEIVTDLWDCRLGSSGMVWSPF